MICRYAAAKLGGKFNTDGNPITISTTKQPFKLEQGPNNTHGCPKTGAITATWQLTTSLPGSPEELPVVLARNLPPA